MVGKILRVDLGTKEVSYEEILAEDELNFLGGAGIAAAIFIREISANIDP